MTMEYWELAKSLARAEAKRLDPPEQKLYPCPTCDGWGRIHNAQGDKEECPHCEGHKEVPAEDYHMGFQHERDPMDILKERRESE